MIAGIFAFLNNVMSTIALWAKYNPPKTEVQKQTEAEQVVADETKKITDTGRP